MIDMIGWDLIYKLTEDELKKKEDVLTLLIHFLLIKSGYKCIGVGDDETISGHETVSETLPSQWNATNNFSIRYSLNNNLFILRGIPVDDIIVYNFLSLTTLVVTNVSFNINDTVDTIQGSLEKLFKNKSTEIVDKIRMELLNTGPGKDVSTETSANLTDKSPVKDEKQTGTNPSPPHSSPIQVPIPPNAHPNPRWIDPEHDPLRVGHSDLEPFGRGGGMIFNPFDPRGTIPEPGFDIPGGMPRGAVPPGARFDPFGPAAGQPRPRSPSPDTDN